MPSAGHTPDMRYLVPEAGVHSFQCIGLFAWFLRKGWHVRVMLNDEFVDFCLNWFVQDRRNNLIISKKFHHLAQRIFGLVKQFEIDICLKKRAFQYGP